jgi:hypothetical protein
MTQNNEKKQEAKPETIEGNAELRKFTEYLAYLEKTTQTDSPAEKFFLASKLRKLRTDISTYIKSLEK